MLWYPNSSPSDGMDIVDQTTAYPEPEDTVILVKGDNPEKLIINDSCSDIITNGDATVLNLTSHAGMALGFFQSTKWVGTGSVYFTVAIVNNDASTSNKSKNGGETAPLWALDKRTWVLVSTVHDDGHEYVLDVDLSRLEEHNRTWLVRHNSKSQAGEIHGQAFKFNNDGSISPKEDPTLFLGRRGNANKGALLIESIWIGNTRKVHQMLNETTNVNSVIGRQSALGMVSRTGSYKIAKLLLDVHNANTGADGMDFQPLHNASYHGKNSIVELLLGKGADPNAVNVEGVTPLGVATQNGYLDCMATLLRHPNIDINAGSKAPIIIAIRNNRVVCLELLLDHGASLDVLYENRYPIQHACTKGIITGLSLAKAILRKRGILRIQKIQNLHGASGKIAIGVLITAYARLNVEDLTRCIVRSFIRFSSDENNKDVNNPFLLCMQLAEIARKQWARVRPTDTTAAGKFHQLYTRLQLGAAAILNEIYQDKTVIKVGGDLEVETKKEINLMNFLEIESSKQAIQIAHNIESRAFFSQPVAFYTISRLWYGDLMYEVFVEPNKNNWTYLAQIVGFVTILLLQLPLIPFLGYLPKCLMEFELSPVTKLFRIKSRKVFIISQPFILFIIQRITDFIFAVAFIRFDVKDLACSVTPDKFILVFAVTSTFVAELRVVVMKGIANYFLVDPFNRLDFPGLFLAALTQIISLACPQDFLILSVVFSIASILLMLRMLRLLTLFPQIGPLTLMLFKMIYKMMLWGTLLIIFVIAFASGLAKLEFGNSCSQISRFAPLVFFEDAISSDSSLFECREQRGDGEVWGFSNVIIYAFFLFGNVMLINMLIAIMGESFSSVWDAQEASYVFQFASHCQTMREMEFLPIQCLYLPYAFYEAGLGLIKKTQYEWNNRLSYVSRDRGKDVTWDDNPKVIPENNIYVEEYGFFKVKEEELLFNFTQYILDRQDEASEEDFWRLNLSKKVTRVEQKLIKKVDHLQELQKKENNRLEKKIDCLHTLLKEILEKMD